MKYRKDYQSTHDIDWFFQYKGEMFHAASNGGELPKCIDSENNRILQQIIENLKRVFNVVMANDVSRIYNENEDLSSFIEYASKGLISLDRTVNEDGKRNRYHKVAYPAVPVNIKYFNLQIRNLMPILEDVDIEIE